jgi:ParB/RepB/Spo0J family partition protein
MTTATATRNAAALTISHAAEMFPALPAAEFDALVSSIRANGILQPVIVNAADEVIDGRHRLNAARAVGLDTVPVVIVDGDDVQSAIAANMARRVLTPSQRGAMAASLMGADTSRAARAAYSSQFRVSASILAACLRLRAASNLALQDVIAGRVSVWEALRGAGVTTYARTVVAAPVAMVEPAPVAPAAPVESAPVPAGLSPALAAVLAAYAAGTLAPVAVQGAAVTVAELDRLATFLFDAADVLATAAR